MSKDFLEMSFDPRTIEHLGVKMYSHIPNAIAELVANAYDAGASEVVVHLHDGKQEKKIEVVDNGIGMDFDDINEKFLRIGRNRREDGADKSPDGKRKVTGKKGLGKLALFGIGDTIEVVTIKKDTGKKISFQMNWQDIIKPKDGTAGAYQPKFNIEDCDKMKCGTTITLKNLRRKSDFDKEALAVGLSKLFNLFDKDFRCSVALNDEEAVEVDNALKFKSIQSEFEWKFPAFSTEKVADDYEHKAKISGKVISTEKPLKPGLRGITLFANGRLVNEPEFFGISESSHGFSYLTGWLSVDFVDDMADDVISTNRQSLNWDLPGILELRAFLAKALRAIERDWKEERKKKRRKNISDTTRVNIDVWYGALPDNVRADVEPIVNALIEDSELPEDDQAKIVQKVHALVPEYPHYHWRHLHSDVQKISSKNYQDKDYYTAFSETVKAYTKKVKDTSGSVVSPDHSMMGAVFGTKNGTPKALSVTKGYKRPNGKDFDKSTLCNIEDGHQELSQGVISGCRNPVAHELHSDLRESNLFNENDCLDALSLLSHLFRRLDDAAKK